MKNLKISFIVLLVFMSFSFILCLQTNAMSPGNDAGSPTDKQRLWYDTPLAGVTIASLFALLTTIANYLFSLIQDKKKWERDQQAKLKEQEYNDSNKTIEAIKNIYHNCISRLSIIESYNEAKNEIFDEKISMLIPEAIDWLSQLSLHQKDNYNPGGYNYHKIFNDFIESPKFHASSLLNEVYRLSMQDKILFPNNPIEKKEENEIGFQINYAIEYRKKCVVEKSITLPSTTTFYLNLNIITALQREKLWELCAENNKGIPKFIYLSLPKYIEQSKTIQRSGNAWHATNVNHIEHSGSEIINQWESDYDNVLKELTELTKKAESKEK